MKKKIPAKKKKAPRNRERSLRKVANIHLH